MNMYLCGGLHMLKTYDHNESENNICGQRHLLLAALSTGTV